MYTPLKMMDILPIECLWAYFTNKVYYAPLPNTRRAIILRIKKEWKKIPRFFLKKIMNEIPVGFHKSSRLNCEQITR